MVKALLQTTQPEVSKTRKPVFVHIDRSTELLDLIGRSPAFWLRH